MATDWEEMDPQPELQATGDWEEVQDPNRSLPVMPQEGFGTSALMAIPRIGEDLIRSGMKGLQSLPGIAKEAYSEIPQLPGVIAQHPGHVAMQALAGTQEAINSLAQAPLNIAKYGANRLNLLPQSVPNAIAKITPEDTTQAISQLFGEPQYPGENLLRGTIRNIPSLYGGLKVGNVLNPRQLTTKGIVADILDTERQQKATHTKAYNNIWDEADKSGFNQVPVDQERLSNNLAVLQKYKTPKEYASLQNFLSNPSLENAQKAQSDMGVIHRKLEEKSRTSALLSEEKALYDAAKDSELHIEDNMFKNRDGEINQPLHDKYDQLTNSYRENVVPYKYNSDIQAYKKKEMLPGELVNALSRGEFMAKRGAKHPGLWLRANSPSLTKTAMGAGGLGGLYYLYNALMGNRPSNPTENQFSTSNR